MQRHGQSQPNLRGLDGSADDSARLRGTQHRRTLDSVTSMRNQLLTQEDSTGHLLRRPSHSGGFLPAPRQTEQLSERKSREQRQKHEEALGELWPQRSNPSQQTSLQRSHSAGAATPRSSWPTNVREFDIHTAEQQQTPQRSRRSGEAPNSAFSSTLDSQRRLNWQPLPFALATGNGPSTQAGNPAALRAQRLRLVATESSSALEPQRQPTLDMSRSTSIRQSPREGGDNSFRNRPAVSGHGTHKLHLVRTEASIEASTEPQSPALGAAGRLQLPFGPTTPQRPAIDNLAMARGGYLEFQSGDIPSEILTRGPDFSRIGADRQQGSERCSAQSRRAGHLR